MPDLIAPHGGVAEPVNRTVANLEAAARRGRDPGLRRRPLDPLSHRRRRPVAADRPDGEGGVRPRPRRGSDRPRRQEVRLDDPARLPRDEPRRPRSSRRQRCYPLINEREPGRRRDRGRATFIPWDKKKYNASVYGTTARGPSRRPHRQSAIRERTWSAARSACCRSRRTRSMAT